MILIKCKQVNREVRSSNPADIIYQFSIFHVISYVTKTSIYIFYFLRILSEYLNPIFFFIEGFFWSTTVTAVVEVAGKDPVIVKHTVYDCLFFFK